MIASKRKRGCNYTAEEINKLLDLVQQYQSAIEDKRTSSIYLSHKREAWEKVCSAYNAIATSGIRTVEQLKILYDNMKQKAKKSLAEHNKKKFMKHNAELSIQNVKEEELNIALEHEKTDKGQWSKTGVGNSCPSITPQDQKILAIIKDQVTPLPNCCEVNEGNKIIMETEPLDDLKINDTKKYKDVVSLEISKKKKKRLINYKELYFKRKCQYAYLQKKKILQDIRLRQKEHSMLKKEHNLKLAILQNEYDEKFK